MVVVSGQTLHIGTVSQVGRVHIVFYATGYVAQYRVRAIMFDSGISIIHVDAEGQLLFFPLFGNLLVVQDQAHGRVSHLETADALHALVRNKSQSGEMPFEVFLRFQVFFFIHQVIQQLLSPFIRQADFMHPFLAWAGTVGKAAQRCVFRRPDSTVVEVCVIFQLNGGRQLINPDQRSCQCVSPIMPAMYHAEHQRIEGIIIRLFGCEVVASVFRVVNGVHLAPVALCIVPDLAYAVATCHDGIFQYRADIYCTGIYIYIIERAFDQSPPQF